MERFGKALLLSAAFTITSAAALSAQASSAHSLSPASQAQSDLARLLSTDARTSAHPDVFASAQDSLHSKDTTIALFVSGCDDPAPWYVFSGIEALTCIFSGQW
ncbi:hypothetical protein [Pseudomonas sp. LRF_L74]|uniref:hypothetical protein n=1 Tax=Pseudomonas sp. LRF_L74 TaxID=3369422 RepID=UPI003F5E90D4